MRPIPPKLRREIADDPYYNRCARAEEGGCRGRITWEHVWIYAGRQVNEKWAIIPLCWLHHLGEGLDKVKNKWISICRATVEDLKKYPNKNWLEIINYLRNKYGHD